MVVFTPSNGLDRDVIERSQILIDGQRLDEGMVGSVNAIKMSRLSMVQCQFCRFVQDLKIA